MSTRFTSSSIIFNDSTVQITSAITQANNAAAGDGALWIDKVSNGIRFKTIIQSGTLFTVYSAPRSVGSVYIQKNTSEGQPPDAPSE
jgi:hypothetical protein